VRRCDVAETQGIVQKLKIVPASSVAFVYIGPAPTNTTLLLISRTTNDAANVGAFKNDMVDAVAAAQVAHREVVAVHGAGDSLITSIRIDPV
jgi:hypothetical protein